jgi:hypothetical protein
MRFQRQADFVEVEAALLPLFDDDLLELIRGFNVWTVYEGFDRDNIAQTGTRFADKQGLIADLFEEWQRWVAIPEHWEIRQRYEQALHQIRTKGALDHPPLMASTDDYPLYVLHGNHQLFAAYEHCVQVPTFTITVLRGRVLGPH